jgi:hypothetical protein
VLDRHVMDHTIGDRSLDQADDLTNPIGSPM